MGKQIMQTAVVDQTLRDNALRRIARRTNDRQNAEDCLHSAYLRMSRYLEHSQVDCTVGFLTQAAVNIWADGLRRDNFLRRHTFEVSFSFDHVAPLQDKVMEDRDRLDRLYSGLERLPARTREIFVLHRIKELKQREIAEQLSISISAVEKHIAKATPFLMNWMKGW